MCGEYGEENLRPHYHAILFGYDFEDKERIPGSKEHYISETLTRIWGYGHTLIAPVTFESIAYVARYVTKKINGDEREVIKQNGLKHYERVNSETGEIYQVIPEYNSQSNRGGGIAKRWFMKYYRDIYPKDYVTINGRKQRSTEYYDDLLKEIDIDMYYEVKEKRFKFMMENGGEDYTEKSPRS